MVETDFTSFESLSSNSYAESFFTREYQLNYLIHCYPKPIICWGNGIIMGGGLGIMAGASHRIVTETARIAMPEITIGLFPDVGGSYFLNRMSGQCGLFVALTGSSLNAADALYANLADAFLPSNLYQKLLSSLCHLNWLDDGQESLHRIIDHLLKQLLEEEVASSSTCPALPTGQLEPLQSYIDNLIVPDSLSDTIQAILNQPQDVLQNNRWLQKGVDSLRKGCPTTAHIIYHQLIRGKNMALADIFEMERRIAIQCCRKGEFQEGVRALLIDKDGNPNWQFPNYEDVPTDWVESFFHSPNI
jgi:enoyl-CoA hydratase/carnithine racemase